MERSDYLEKQINQLGKVLGTIFARLLDIKNASMSETNLVLVAVELLKNELNIDMDELLTQPDDTFIEKLQTNLDFSAENLDQLANMLTLLAQENSGKHSFAMYQKVLSIHLFLQEKDSVYSLERQWKIDEIRNSIREISSRI